MHDEVWSALVTTGAALDANHIPHGRVHVRPATEADLPDLLRLWDELQANGGRQARDALHVAIDDVAQRLLDAIHDTIHRVVVAAVGDAVHGMAVLARTSLGPLSTASAVQLHHVVVANRHRRSGVGHALLAAAAAYADEVGAEHILVGVAPTLRDANRFYARLGFSPVVVRRMTTVTSLRRRLTDCEHPVASLEDLTRRRLVARPRRIRTARRRFPVGGPTL
jgi:N-acetylglutamate synthase-like GNAT family acetyltransferase